MATGDDTYPTAWVNTIWDGAPHLHCLPRHSFSHTNLKKCLCGAGDTDQSIFGAPFLEAFYTSFDRQNHVLGFAPASHKCGNHLQGIDKWPITGCTDQTFAECVLPQEHSAEL